MKKAVLMSCLVLLSTLSFCQGLYVKAGGGYAFPMASQSLFESSSTVYTANNRQGTTATNTTQDTRGSYGAGITFNAAVGYKFSPFIGLDLNLNYLSGNKIENTALQSSANGSLSLTSTTQSMGFFVSPTVLFMAGSEKIRPYGLVGVTAGSVKLTDTQKIISTIGDGGTASITSKTTGNIAVGMRGGIGVDINIASKFSIYAEGVFNAVSYFAKEKEITEVISNGISIMDRLPESSIRTVYKKEISSVSIDGTTTVDSTKPTEALRKPLPLSSLGINIGLKFKLGSD